MDTPLPPVPAESCPGPAAPAATPGARPEPPRWDPRDEACRILLRLESPEARARELVDEALEALRPAPKDAALLSELVFGTLRQRALLDHRLSAVSHRPLEALSPWVRCLLRLSLYQILCLDAQQSAEAVEAAAAIALFRGHEGISKFVAGCLREVCRQRAEDKLPPLPTHPVPRLAVETSHPLWLAEAFYEAHGWDRAAAALRADNQAAPLTLRVNPLRGGRDALATRLHQAGLRLEPCRHSAWGLRVRESADVRRAPGFLEGDFHVQDESAQLLAPLLSPEPGWSVADVCAAPGGKAALLAEWVGPGGRVWAFDRKPGALDKLQASLRRQGLDNVLCETRDSTAPRPDLGGALDAAVVDAPSSCLGILRRRPEARWQARPDAVPGLAERQFRLLKAAATYLKPGGVLVYFVATWTPEETSEVVERFLDSEPGFAFERAQGRLPAEVCSRDGFLRIWPGQDGMDGAFAARMRRAR